MNKEVEKHLLELTVVLPSMLAGAVVGERTGSFFLSMVALGATGSALGLLFTFLKTKGEEKPNLTVFFVVALALGSIPYILFGLIFAGSYAFMYGYIAFIYGSIYVKRLLAEPFQLIFWAMIAFVAIAGLRAIIKAGWFERKRQSKGASNKR